MGRYVAVIVALIVFLGFCIRVVGIDWDQGYYLHPDERAIVMFSLPLSFPTSVGDFLSVDSPLNPHFFAYGSVPLYLLAGGSYLAGFAQDFLSEYSGAYLVARFFSVIIDSGIILLVYFIGRRVFGVGAGLIGAFFYAIAVFPIQASHFYTADVYLSFFMLLSFLLLLKFIEGGRFSLVVLSALSFGVALASKISAAPYLLIVCVGIFFSPVIHLLSNKKWGRIWGVLLRSVIIFFVFLGVSILTFIVFEPYAVIDRGEFMRQISEQQSMTRDASVFPYTLQYMGKMPYIYEIKQIIFWGLGIPLSFICIFGLLHVCVRGVFGVVDLKKEAIPHVLVGLYFFVFFIIVGSFAVGWMRYLLPLYPILCLCGGVFVVFLYQNSKKFVPSQRACVALFGILLFLCSVWTILFLQIYTSPHTRVEATRWIHENIPMGAQIAVEHWDDIVPLYDSGRYVIVQLPLYEADTHFKWEGIHAMIESSDYIVISSARLYVPLMRLRDCEKYNPTRCYPDTAAYYDSLFSGQMPFKKVAEFTSYPKVPFTGIHVYDDSADESFSVYDHPKVMIFERIRK